MRPVVRRILVAAAWLVAGVVVMLVSWVAALVVANLTGIGETAPGTAARAVAAELDDESLDRLDEGRFCGFPCLVNVLPDGPSYEGSAALRLVNTSSDRIAEALTAAGFEPGDAGLEIPAHQRRDLEDRTAGIPVVWHARDIAGSHAVVAQVSRVGDRWPHLSFDEAYPPAPVRWAAPATGLLTAGGLAWTAVWFRRRVPRG